MTLDEANSVLAKRLRAAIRETGLTVVEIAPLAGMSSSSLYRKLRGDRDITFGELVVLAALTKRHPSSFLRDL